MDVVDAAAGGAGGGGAAAGNNEYEQVAYRERRLKLVRQHTLRQNTRNVKLKRSKNLYFFNMLAIFVLQCIAIYFFKVGFLLSRQVLPNVSTGFDLEELIIQVPQQSIEFYQEAFSQDVNIEYQKGMELFGHELALNSSSWMEPKFKKAVILVIDALRFDFVVPVDESDKQHNRHYHNNFNVLYETYCEQPENTALFRFVADPPTTTLQRLKGLTTGSLPTFVDAGSNFDGDEINEDNIMYQLHSVGSNITLVGDDTWDSLFKTYLNRNLSWPYESLNVWDIHTVDNGVLEHLYPLLGQGPGLDQWQVIVGHFLGMDHVGHRYGPDNQEMANKQQQMDREMRKVIQLVDDDTVLVIMGDHGMDSTGNHGGDSKLELDSTLFVYSKQPAFKNQNSGRTAHKSYKLEHLDNEFPTIPQIDFVPTISLLLGIPIPYNNLGKPINALHTDTSLSSHDALLQLVKVNYLNILNLQRYKMTLITETNAALQNKQSFDEFLSIVANVSAINDFSAQQLQNLLTLMTEHQEKSLSTFQNIWAKFNNTFIYIGITLMLFSLLILVLLAKIIPSVVFNQLITEFLTIIILMIFFWLTIINAIYVILKPAIFTLSSINLLGVSIGIIFGFLIIIFDRYNVAWLFKQFRFFINDPDSSWSFISLLILVISFLSYSSNSFIIFQDSILNFILINYGLYNVWVFVKKYLTTQATLSKNEIVYGLIHSITFTVIQKLNSLIKTCREEQSNHCPKMITNTNGLSTCQTTNNFSPASLFLLLFLSLIFPNILQLFLNIGNSNSYQSSAKLWIGIFLRIVVLANFVYWFLDYIEFHPEFNSRFFNLSFVALKSLKLTIARILIGLCLVVGNFAWSKGPLCISLISPQHSVEDEKPYENDQDEANKTGKTKIVGFRNIYGSSYLLFVLNFFGAILVTNKPLSSVSAFLLVYQILTTLELINILNLRNNMIGPIIFNLLAYSYFYSSDHQITINSIKWDLAFQLTDSIIFPFSHISIFLNSFGPFILVGLSVILIVIWKIPPNMKPISLLSKIIVTCLTLLMSQTVITLSSLIFTNLFKRHLMVWKIFVPCFLFNSLILIVLNIVIIFISFFFGVTKLVLQINRIFGK